MDAAQFQTMARRLARFSYTGDEGVPRRVRKPENARDLAREAAARERVDDRKRFIREAFASDRGKVVDESA